MQGGCFIKYIPNIGREVVIMLFIYESSGIYKAKSIFDPYLN
jgi:hypothetical protein